MVMKKREIHMMGTVIQLMVQDVHAEVILDEIIVELEELEHRFSAHDETSELMQVNNNAGVLPVRVNPSLYKLVKIGKEHSVAENSSLNIAIGPLVKQWNIGFKDAQKPSDNTIQSLLKITNANEIILNDEAQTVYLKHKGMFIDLGALAKGYIADILVESFEKKGVLAGLINLGGNVMTYGKSPKQPDGYWRIGIQHPFLSRGNYVSVFKAFNQSVVTSGIYERKSIIDNQTYHHILDPNTGYPIETEVASLTIISPHSVDGEIWTGRLFGMPPKQVMDTLNELIDIEGIVITKTGEIYYTEALKSYLTEPIL